MIFLSLVESYSVHGRAARPPPPASLPGAARDPPKGAGSLPAQEDRASPGPMILNSTSGAPRAGSAGGSRTAPGLPRGAAAPGGALPEFGSYCPLPAPERAVQAPCLPSPYLARSCAVQAAYGIVRRPGAGLIEASKRRSVEAQASQDLAIRKPKRPRPVDVRAALAWVGIRPGVALRPGWRAMRRRSGRAQPLPSRGASCRAPRTPNP